MKIVFASLIIAFASACTPASKPNTSAAAEITSLTATRWQLIELNGNPVTTDSTQHSIPQMTLKTNDSTFSGNTGCNNMAGTYQAKEMNRISFSKIIATKMACLNTMELESDFLRVLEQADNFIITGDTLVLNKARMAPLAKFKGELMNNQ